MTDESKTKLLEFFKDTVKTVGVPTVMLCALAFAVWQALVWGGTNIMLPLVNKQVESLAKVDASQETITKTQERMVDRLDKITKDVENNHRTIQDMASRQDKNFDEVISVLQQINSSIKENKK